MAQLPLRNRVLNRMSNVLILALLGGCAFSSFRVGYAEYCVKQRGGNVTFEGSACTIVNLQASDVADADLACLQILRPQFAVYLQGTDVTDNCVPHFRGLQPWRIDLRGTLVSSMGVKRLQALTASSHGCDIITD